MVFSTAYLPSIIYMAEIIRSKTLVVDIHETYQKQTGRNHCSIYGPNGKQTLTIPVSKVNGKHTLTKDIRISYHQPWQKNHWRSMETAYNNSPFFLYYQDTFAPFYQTKYTFLIDFNAELLLRTMKLLKIECALTFSSNFIRDGFLLQREMLLSKHARFDNPFYLQPFHSKSGFVPNLSIVDCIFNLGPETAHYLQSVGSPFS